MNQMSRYSDDELISASREGKNEAVDQLLERYKPLVLKLSRARFIAGGERDDLIQEGMIGLYKAVRDYDPDRTASFATFAALCIDRQMLNAIDASRREKNLPLNNSVGLTDEELEQAVRQITESPEKIVIEQEMTDEKIAWLRENLSPLEKKVLGLYISGLDYREIAAVLGKPPKSVDNALQRIRRKSRTDD